jgi:hypothetical protein
MVHTAYGPYHGPTQFWPGYVEFTNFRIEEFGSKIRQSPRKSAIPLLMQPVAIDDVCSELLYL